MGNYSTRETLLKAHFSEDTAASSRFGAAHELTQDIPLGLIQVIEVYQEAHRNQVSYNDAVKIVAQRRSLKSVHTIYDACTRRIGINTNQFKQLLQDKSQLRKHLISQYPDYESYIISALA